MSAVLERVLLPRLGFAAAWREAARGLLLRRVSPEQVDWQREDDAPGLPLFGAQGSPPAGVGREFRMPRALLGLIDDVLCADVPERFSLPYSAVWRAQAERDLLGDESDPDMARLRVLSKLVHRDAHKMKAFVRFCEEASHGDRRAFAAWFEPDHFIVGPQPRFLRGGSAI